MTKAEYTPGPWVIETDTQEPYNKDAPIKVWVGPALVYSGDPYKMTAEDDANARLIASAPELLEALEELLMAMNPSMIEWHSEEVGKARAAIAKARAS